MPIKTFKDNAALELIDALDDAGVVHVLQCLFSATDIALGPSDLLDMLKNAFGDGNMAVFFCADGDAFVSSHDTSGDTNRRIKTLVRNRLSVEHEKGGVDAFFKDYELPRDANELRAVCMNKKDSLFPLGTEKARQNLRNRYLAKFTAAQENRTGRTKPEILIVEDIEPSRKLLKAVIGNVYKCHAAADMAEAVSLYMQHAPDIVFLDIQLPDGNGHDLARFLNELDPDAFIVMATANSQQRDVQTAKENRVKGYVTKPITLEKVQKCLASYFNLKEE